ncbi:MAG: hypothetical protein EB015_12340 [Methylocystaceae bacterium]|nr:hypothetical protein [Methylocystaceae bacterium]
MIDKSKIYRTRDGREVRIYATDGGGEYPVHGAILDDDKWRISKWDKTGMWAFHQTEYDLIEDRPRHQRTVWLNVYDNEVISGGWKTRAEADGYHERHRIACIKVDLDFEEGEGL